MKYDYNPSIPLLDFEAKPLRSLYEKLKNFQEIDSDAKAINDLKEEILNTTKKTYANLNNWDLTQIARHPKRPYALDYIDFIFENFIEMHGDRNFKDDQSTVCGIAQLEGQSVVLVAQQKGRTTEENLKRNFGMPQPEGYRKALRFFNFASKFNKPIITFIDTPGAFPGLAGEERSQGEAIARNLKVMSGLKVPIVSIVIGEGGSGGALGIGVANVVLMLEYAIYSVISPESCASILWRNPDKKVKAANALKNDSNTALKFKIIDEIIKEPLGGAHRNWALSASNIKNSLTKSLSALVSKTPNQLTLERIEKYAKMGEFKKLPSDN